MDFVAVSEFRKIALSLIQQQQTLLWLLVVLVCRFAATAAAKSLQSCPTLCDPRDGSPPGSPIPGILQARTLEWVAISSSNAWKWKVKVKPISHVQVPATPWTAAHQAPPSMGLSRQEYWSGVYVWDDTKDSFQHLPTLFKIWLFFLFCASSILINFFYIIIDANLPMCLVLWRSIRKSLKLLNLLSSFSILISTTDCV